MGSNIFLHDCKYSLVRSVWDYCTNGDIDVVNPKKYDKVEYLWVCPFCGKHFKSKPLYIANHIDKYGLVICKDCSKGFSLSEVGRFDSISDIYPNLVKFWDFDKNGFIKPNMIRAGSNTKVWWVCQDCGKSYLRSPNTMSNTSQSGYCSDCYKKHRKFKYGSLADIFPDKAIYWSSKNILKPEDVPATQSKKKYFWECIHCGYEWSSSVFDVVNNLSKCPVCEGSRFKSGYTDLATMYPNVAKDWDYSRNNEKPCNVFYKDKGSYWFICPKCGKSYIQSLHSVIERGTKCFSCTRYGNMLKGGENSLYTVRPDLAKQFDENRNGISSKDILPNDTRQMWWKCDKGHSFKRSCHQRSKSQGVCPVCDCKIVVKGYNDFESCFPELLKYWCYDLNDCLPSEVSKNSSKVVNWVCPICNNVYEYRVDDRTRSVGCPLCSFKGYVSQEEKELFAIISSWGLNVQENVRLFEDSRHSVDIYIPDKNIAIEFNGLYWHSDKVVGKSYHYDKYKRCKDIGVDLIFVWEDDFVRNRQVLLRTLRRKLGVSEEEKVASRKCVYKEITFSEAKVFLDNNHIQGSVSGTVYFGGFYNNMLVSVGVFDKLDVGKFIMKRYCTNCILQGGFSKMISEFRLYSWCNYIETFSDNGISNGKLYLDNGFNIVSILKYDYQYVVKGRRVHKYNYRKNRFINDPSLVYIDGLTESELADLNNISRVWDAGKVKYAKRW